MPVRARVDLLTNIRRSAALVLAAVAVALVAISSPRTADAAGTGGGNAWTWGANNGLSLLGGGKQGSVTKATQMALPAGVQFASIALNTDGGAAVDATGRLWTWGDYQARASGPDAVTTQTAGLVRVPAGAVFTSVRSGPNYYAALDTRGRAWTWGRGYTSAVFGAGRTSGGNVIEGLVTPVAMPAGVAFSTLAPGSDYMVAIDTQGRLWSWGYNEYGQLGNGSMDPTLQVAVNRPQLQRLPSGVKLKTISASVDFWLAADTRGHLWYGGQEHSQNDYQANVYDESPKQLSVSGALFVQVAAGQYFAIALSSSGTAYGWGNDTSGQDGSAPAVDMSRFGQGSLTPDPKRVATPSGVRLVSIAAYQDSAAAVDSTGHVWVWGSDGNGQLADGHTQGISVTPVRVAFPAGVSLTAVAGSPFDGATLVAFHYVPAPDWLLSTIASSLLSPYEAFVPAATVAVSGGLTLGAVLFMTFPANMFNLTLQENYEEIRRRWLRLVPWRRAGRRPSQEGSPSQLKVVGAFAAVVLGGALLGSLNDPTFGSSRSSLATYAASVAATVEAIAVGAVVTAAYHRAHSRRGNWALRAIPAGLVIAAACVLVSRLTHFQPGYLYGLVAGVVFAHQLASREKGHVVALTTLTTLAVAVGAWFATVPLGALASQPDVGFLPVAADDMLSIVFAGGVVGTVISLLPLQFLPGGTLKEWHWGAWGGVFGVAFFLLVQVMLRPHPARPSAAPLATTIALFVLFGVLSVAFREYFASRHRRALGRARLTFGERLRELLRPMPPVAPAPAAAAAAVPDAAEPVREA